ncbi:MAG: ribonuclease III [Clostridia bacterium]
MENKKLLSNFERSLGYNFKNEELLKLALTHKSFAYETGVKKKEYNERIEFLGDAILEHIISEMLYLADGYLSEGQMSKKRAAIVCENSLCIAMKQINGQEYIYLGKCEDSYNIKEAIIADAFEAVIGAIYLDSSYAVTRKIVLQLLDEEIKKVLNGEEFNADYKTKLQEKLQINGNVKIEYITIEEAGPIHDRTFKVELLFNDNKIGEGIGKSKKQAEQNAAKDALEKKYKS